MADKIIIFSVYSYMDVLAKPGVNIRPVGWLLSIHMNSFNKFVKYLQGSRICKWLWEISLGIIRHAIVQLVDAPLNTRHIM